MNNRELDVLNILLNSNEPLTSTDITNCRRDLTQSTVIAVLRKLGKLEYVEVVGTAHVGKVLARTYKATDLSRKAILQYFAESYQPFVETIGISQLVKEILSSVDEDTKNKMLEELKAML